MVFKHFQVVRLRLLRFIVYKKYVFFLFEQNSFVYISVSTFWTIFDGLLNSSKRAVLQLKRRYLAMSPFVLFSCFTQNKCDEYLFFEEKKLPFKFIRFQRRILTIVLEHTLYIADIIFTLFKTAARSNLALAEQHQTKPKAINLSVHWNALKPNLVMI